MKLLLVIKISEEEKGKGTATWENLFLSSVPPSLRGFFFSLCLT